MVESYSTIAGTYKAARDTDKDGRKDYILHRRMEPGFFSEPKNQLRAKNFVNIYIYCIYVYASCVQNNKNSMSQNVDKGNKRGSLSIFV